MDSFILNLYFKSRKKMIGKPKHNPRGFVDRSAAIDSSVQHTLKKLNIFKSGSAINIPKVPQKEKPKSILKSGAIPSVCAVAATLKNNALHTVKICGKRFYPRTLTVEKGDSVEFVVDPGDSPYNKYVICVADIDESNLLSPKGRFKTTFDSCGEYTIK